MLSSEIITNYISILKDELRPAMGCTEPISIAYAAAILTDVLGGRAEEIAVGLSGNIIKNVKSVVVPATGGMHGIESAVAAGVIADAFAALFAQYDAVLMPACSRAASYCFSSVSRIPF